MNLKHLYYFWKVAKHGGVMRAGEAIHISPQTLSGQIKLLEEQVGVDLFKRNGRNLELTEAGKVAFEYAEDMFAIGAELDQVLRDFPRGRPTEFRVGVSDVLPKSLAYRILRPAIKLATPIRIICREGPLDRLLGELALHRLDLVISDAPVPTNINVRAYSHKLGESGISFLAHKDLVQRDAQPFPTCLEQLPLLMPSEDTSLGRVIVDWVGRKKLRIHIAGIFDDTALMAAFGQEMVGAFPVPSILSQEFSQGGSLINIGELDGVSIEYFALSVQRRLTHPCVIEITKYFEKHKE